LTSPGSDPGWLSGRRVQEKPDHHNRQTTAHLLQSSCNAKCPSSSRATIFWSRMKIVHVLRILHACTMVINFCYSSSTQKTMDSPWPHFTYIKIYII
jgi:hypothetical protein